MSADSMTEFNITPMGKPRMTRSDRWKQRPVVLRYWTFKDECKAKGLMIPESGSHLIFVLPMPKSWSKKKKLAMDGKPHQSKPDVDNITKACLDAVYEDDSHIWDIRTSKIWGDIGKIIISDESTVINTNYSDD